ncbi:GNAT family N-acetyltransferase [Cloacibacterium normanense]|jgi:N-acetylglutamate synthase-like GNAT family acetyltransferase|uniref:GNAT family N-acetyltransferase n=1 Tax=Cloacibacterium TaxID=501783 RepID=UPI0035AF6605
MNIEIIDFEPKYRDDFKNLNVEWLEKYFEVEPYDKEVLSNPEKYILEKGGKIFFAKLEDKIIGTVALMPKNSSFELTKMAVTDKIQSKGIGSLLMQKCIDEAKNLGLKEIFLFSNTKLDKAINLYKKVGFLEEHFDSSDYKRANIYMTLKL